MAGFSSAPFTGGSANRHRVDFYISQASQNYATNQTTFYWEVYLVHVSGSPGSWRSNVDSTWSVNIGGATASGLTNYDFRNNLYGSKLLGSGYTTFNNDANGYLQIYASGAFSTPGNIGSGSAGGYIDASRIPKPPAQNGMPVVSNVQPTAATFTWPANGNNNGAAIDQYLLRVNKNNPADSAGYVDYPLSPSVLSHTVTGLTPGTRYYAVVYAHNSQGYAVKSSQAEFKTLSGAYVRRGTEWRPTEVLVRRNGQWVPGEVFVYRSGAWVPAA